MIKDKGNVSNVVFGMSGDSWNQQPQERSKLKRVIDVSKYSKILTKIKLNLAT